MDSQISAFEIIDLVKKKTQVSQLTQPGKSYTLNGNHINAKHYSKQWNDNRKRLNARNGIVL